VVLATNYKSIIKFRRSLNMRRNSKLLAAILCTAMTVSLCACGGTENSTTSSSGEDVTITQAANENVDEQTSENDVTDSTDNQEEEVDTSHTVNALPDPADFSAIKSQIAGRITVDGTDFVVDDNVIFINGVNTPWDNWNDLGGSFDEEFWSTHFAELKDEGINATRIWISCNGANLDIQPDGYVNGPKEAFWNNMDTLLQLAEENGIYIMATVMSFDNFKDESNNNYTSWRAMLDSEESMDSFVDNFIVPLSQRYNGFNSLWSIDLCNEPDWIYENEECGKIDWEKICALFAKEAAAIHENSDILVTVGFGIIKYNSDNYNGNYGSDEYLQSFYNNENAYLDFYEPHYYEWQKSWFSSPFEVDPVTFGTDGSKPVVIGEFPATGFEGMSGSECYINAFSNGYNGVMAWTSNGVDDCGSLEDFVEGANQIAEVIADVNENE
jgi:hypothetical protein